MGNAALKINPPEFPDRPCPRNYTVWSYPYRDLPEALKWRIYDDAKTWRWHQEWNEVEILEDYREFCSRVCRELEL